jgi:hypothetical protein
MLLTLTMLSIVRLHNNELSRLSVTDQLKSMNVSDVLYLSIGAFKLMSGFIESMLIV